MGRDFEEGKRYVVSLSTKFEGEFVGYEEDERGIKLAVFNTGGVNRYGPEQRKVPVHNVVESGLIKI